MAHEVTLDIATKFVLHKDVKIEVKTDDGKLGTLLVSKGNVEWLPAGNFVNKKRLSWAKFAELMEAQGKAVKVKKKAAALFFRQTNPSTAAHLSNVRRYCRRPRRWYPPRCGYVLARTGCSLWPLVPSTSDCTTPTAPRYSASALCRRA